MAKSKRTFGLGDLVFAVVASALFLAVIARLNELSRFDPVTGRNPTETPFFLDAPVLFVAFVMTLSFWSVYRSARKQIRCVECGRVILANAKSETPARCDGCRLREATPQERSAPVRNGFLILGGSGLIFSVGIGFFFTSKLEASTGWSYLPSLLLATFLVFLTLVLMFFGYVYSTIFWKRRMLQDPERPFELARKIVGTSGTEIEAADLRILSLGANELANQIPGFVESTRKTMSDLLGDVIPSKGTIRLVVFGKRDDYLSFCLKLGFDAAHIDGLTFTAPFRLIVLMLDSSSCRWLDAQNQIRATLSYQWLDDVKGNLPAPWLQQGIAAQGRSDQAIDRARIQRRLALAISLDRTIPSDEFFGTTVNQMMKLVAAWRIQSEFACFMMFQLQARSFVGFLADSDPSSDRRRTFQRFVKGLAKGVSHAEVFEREFGQSLESALADWQVWIRSKPTPDDRTFQNLVDGETLSQLRNSLIPKALDRSLRLADRIHAVRSIGQVGASEGAAPLLDLWRSDPTIPPGEIIWSLEQISGRSLGETPNAWSAYVASCVPGADDLILL